MLTFANPAGLWALLGIPAVLAIHFLQRQAVVLPISTLFLLEKTQRESASGRKIDRLMNSVPLWMQLIGVLLLTWLLTEPRYQKAKSTQRVAVVLDSSASMSVFKDDLKEQLTSILPDLQGPAAAIELTLLESTPGREKLYAGPSIENAMAVLDAWTPRDGLTDPGQSLRLGRSLVAREGIVLYATDTPIENPPYDAQLIAVGEKVDNVGLTGVTFSRDGETLIWNTLVRNYSDSSTSRTWQVEYPDGTRSEPTELELAPKALVSLSSAFPKNAERLRLILSPDRFTLDDSMPLVSPAPKAISLFAGTSPAFSDLSERMLRSLEATEPTNDAATADLALVSYDPLDPVLPPGNAVVFVHDETRGGAYLKGGIVAEKHPLVDDLNWQALLVRETIQLQRLPTDDVLLWQGTRPLIFLRQIAATPDQPTATQLCFNFDLRLSNATTQPAFIVALHRFTETLRSDKIAGYRDNLETGQPVEIAAHTGRDASPITLKSYHLSTGKSETQTLPPSPRIRFKAPIDPGFLEITQGDDPLLAASLQFADTREADFSACATTDLLDTATATAVERHTKEDHWWRAWILLLVAALLVSWYFSKERSAPSKGAPTSAGPTTIQRPLTTDH